MRGTVVIIMRSAVALAFMGMFTMIQTGSALAWNGMGHEVVAAIAEKHLTATGRLWVGELLSAEGKTSIVEVARWADRIRDLKVGVQPSHLVRLPLDEREYDPAKQCKNHRCIIGAIDESVAALNDPALPTEAKVAALKYIVHLVGDIHQPLHASEDPGVFKVIFKGKEMTFHDVWDSAFIRSRKMSVHDIADMVDDFERGNAPAGGSTVSWAIESRNLARDVLLRDLGAQRATAMLVLPDDYLERHWPAVRLRLEQAGLRLASLLNGIRMR
ncbi:S1/P1 nuclease [Rhizobium sp. NTR19]|uniref:S1/P1 nuclease n=1 Tax=Neorhizobium turbinariae TaxID=2937795 RepID=A0ABT0IRR1_9HYPH|nr:S1/P1 nuclease [Neorhizobium turbinariae]MCK8780572.1 S1/P1 nuclease [Neorhizobium turbinariae]